MVDTKVLQRIREQEMDRKEFLKYTGVVVLGLVGIKGLIALLDPLSRPQYITKQPTQPTTPSKNGFGGGRYGA